MQRIEMVGMACVLGQSEGREFKAQAIALK